MSGYLALSVDLAGMGNVDQLAAAAETACFDAGALCVTLTDAVDDAILEPAPGEVRLWPQTVLQAVFDADTAGPQAIIALATALDVPANRIRAERVADRVWEREWLKDFHSMRFGVRLWIVPSHEAPPADPKAVIVKLDPGLAFGTGTHPSTALCLEWLDGHLPDSRAMQGLTVVDYGCGSGVLAVAAALLGVGQGAPAVVHAFDIDPQALIATRDNAEANDVAGRIVIHASGQTLPKADVVLANILAGTLIELAAPLSGLVRAGGHLVLAGILDEQVAEVRAAFAPHATLHVSGQRDGWSALSGKCIQPAQTAR
ncbi:MAG: 50S ribosomal protein L11 methyltransferase [Pseudomonadota bacterium]